MNKNDKIYIAGQYCFVGRAIVRSIEKKGYNNLFLRTCIDLNQTNKADANQFFEKEELDYVLLAAVKVGGIHVNNTCPADFIRDDL
jgi:GDP-L-fucose synthase